jgi:hypothetical protein
MESFYACVTPNGPVLKIFNNLHLVVRKSCWQDQLEPCPRGDDNSVDESQLRDHLTQNPHTALPANLGICA